MCDLVRQRGLEVTGYDTDNDVVTWARHKYPDLHFINDPSSLALSYKSIILGEVLEHVEKPENLLIQVRGRIMNGGRVIITVPHGVNEHPDHKHTFHIYSFWKLIHNDYKLRFCQVKDGFIRYVGTKIKDRHSMNRPPKEVLDQGFEDLIEQSRYHAARSIYWEATAEVQKTRLSALEK